MIPETSRLTLCLHPNSVYTRRMRHLRTPNTKFDLYILPNVPPKGPDLTGEDYLHTWFFPGMQNNEGATGRTFFYDACLDVELKNDARDDWPTPPAGYRIYIPTMLDQGYDVVFVERFRPLGLPDFKRIFLKRRQWSAKKGLITEGGLRLAGSGTQARPISATGGLHLAATASYLSRGQRSEVRSQWRVAGEVGGGIE